MTFRLGYVDGPFSLPNSTFKTITYTSYKKLNQKDALQKLDNIINENLDNLLKILKFNKDNNISFYRMSHTLIPLATLKDVHFDYIKKYKNKWQIIGNFIKDNNMRIDSHPNQYCVLNSNNNDIVENSIQILKFNYSLFKAMNINGKTILHVGGKFDNKEESIKRFKNNFLKLDKNLKNMIILENDDKIYTIKDVIEICEELKIPMVLDYHHYLCNNNKEKLTDYMPRIINTWKNTNLLPKIHFSSPKSKKDFRSHNYFIDYNSFLKFLNKIKTYNQNFDIMLECKGKDDALFRISKQLKYTNDIKSINQTTFKVK